MFGRLIDIYEIDSTRDEYNERQDVYQHKAQCYAQVTESGGRENMYASRIIHENEAVYTIRYRDGITAGMFVEDAGIRHKIKAIYAEGRRFRQHLLITINDAED